jgi:hypothetical protein
MTMPIWLEYLLKGLAVFAMIALPAVVASRAGKSPYFALLLLVPIVQIWVVWAFAFTDWPKVDKKT